MNESKCRVCDKGFEKMKHNQTHCSVKCSNQHKIDVQRARMDYLRKRAMAAVKSGDSFYNVLKLANSKTEKIVVRTVFGRNS